MGPHGYKQIVFNFCFETNSANLYVFSTRVAVKKMKIPKVERSFPQQLTPYFRKQTVLLLKAFVRFCNVKKNGR